MKKINISNIQALATLNDKAITKYFIKSEAEKLGISISTTASELALSAAEYTQALARKNGDEEVVKKAEAIEKLIFRFISEDNFKFLQIAECKAHSVSRQQEYNPAMRIVITALHQGYKF